MRWDDTIASGARYGDVAGRIFRDGDVIWEASEDDYQGNCNILVAMPDGRFAHYEWSYGSCSGCDDWESRDLSPDQIEQEMRESAAWFNDIDTLRRYLRLEGEFKKIEAPTAQGVPLGMTDIIRTLSGGSMTEFKAMGEAFERYESERSSERGG